MTSRGSRKYLSAAEIAAMLSYVRTRADLARQKGTTRAVVDELIVLLLVRAGLRTHELRALKIADLPAAHGETTLWIRDGKPGLARKVQISEELAERLTRFVRFYRNGRQTEDRLLESERGGPLSYMSLYSKLRRVGREAGIAKLTPASLRRTYVQQLFQAEQDLRYVQEQAGYKGRRSIAGHLKIGGVRAPAPGCRRTAAGATQPEQRAIGPAGTEPTTPCEACGIIIANGRGARIESGQLLCDGCLKYFRRA